MRRLGAKRRNFRDYSLHHRDDGLDSADRLRVKRLKTYFNSTLIMAVLMIIKDQ